MFSKFTVKLIKIPADLRRVVLFSSLKTPCGPIKNWKFETSTSCDNDKILNFMYGKENCWKEDPIVKALIQDRNPRILKKMSREMLDQRLTLIARNCCNKQIIGVSINEVSCKLNGAKLCKMCKEIEDCDLKKYFEVQSIIANEPKIHEKLHTDEIFNIAQLAVAESHYGNGIGLELVKQSLDFARKNNFSFAKMSCTSDGRRNIAEQLNMKKVWCGPYDDIMCRGINQPRSLPPPPNTGVSVFYIDLKEKC